MKGLKENGKEENKKTNSKAIILLMSLDREVWVTFSQSKLKVCKLTNSRLDRLVHLRL